MEQIFKRKIYQEFLDWKNRNKEIKQTALVVKGSRQIGKTTIVNQFAHDQYESVIYLNFMTNSNYKECFSGNLDVDTIVSELNFRNKSFKFIPNKTVIIFDEIQECAKARSSIKPFCLDGRYDIIATGSLLGVSGYNKYHDASIPVGFETQIKMHPMDFREFLWALDYTDEDIEYFKSRVQNRIAITESKHNVMFDLYRWYLNVGGMPDAVKTYIKTKDINEVRKMQQLILDSYRDDFGKHLNIKEEILISNKDKSKLNLLYDSIPRQLAKSNDFNDVDTSLKFKFSEIEPNAKFRDYCDLIQWLSDAGLINICHNLSTVSSPISAYAIPNFFKIFMNDTGLFMASLSDEATITLWEDNMAIYKGFIYENVVAEQLVKNGFKLYYYEKKSKNEVDFIISNKQSIFAIETKAKNGKRKSLKDVLSEVDDKEPIKGIKLSRQNIGFSNGILTMPYYLCFLIDDKFSW